MEINIESFNPNYFIIDCPLIVKNQTRALQMFGGLDNILTVWQKPEEILSINLTPESLAARGAFLHRIPCTHSFILKIKRKKGSSKITSIACIGRVATRFVSQTMIDFQYLPMTRQPDDSYLSMHEHLTFKEVRDWTSLNNADPEMYMVPATFSRFRYPVHNYFTTENESCNNKCDKKISACFVPFDVKSPVPLAPEIDDSFLTQRNLQILKKLKIKFAERPIWTRLAIAANIKEQPNGFKDALNQVAYYYLSGPWKRCWVRYGYDPRIDASSKCYQIVDYRATFPSIRQQSLVKARYNPDLCRVKKMQINRTKKNPISDNCYIFRNDLIPGARNIFYQLIDMKNDEIQILLHSNDGREPRQCHPTDGWCIQGYQDLCRTIIHKQHEELISTKLKENDDPHDSIN